MSLTPGTRLGPYEIVSALGVGGMGEVYRAHDAKLNRDVAIKVLLPAVANDPDRLARFSREAQVLASLNHPNIAHIHGLEESGGVTALVLELVEGEDLAQRIARGPIPLDEALPIARQIAEALEAAHDHGIIHRDLKPANIKVRTDGTVKVLDFGLAKAVDQGSGIRDQGSAGAANSPTLSIHATEAGLILGTAAYMSPEQASGKPVDKRSDLWAFGVVLMEMMTGRQVFKGETVSHVIAAVLKDEPDWGALPSDTPTPVRRLLARCLTKERKRRFADAADAGLEIEDAINARRGAEGEPHHRSRRWSSPVVPWLVAAVAMSVIIWNAVVGRATLPAADPVTPVRFSLALPEGSSLAPGFPAFAVAPDGRSFVVSIRRESPAGTVTRLELRRFDRPDFIPIAGGEWGTRPFFLADGQRIGFLDAQTFELKVVDLSGGPARVVCQLGSSDLLGATSGPDDSIVFAHSPPGVPPALRRVAATGGSPSLIAEPDPAKAETVFSRPHLLPDQEHVVFTANYATGGGGTLEVLSLKTGARRQLIKGTSAQYVSSGHLVFLRAAGPVTTDLVAARFNPTTLTLQNEPVLFAAGILVSPEGDRTEFAIGGGVLLLSRRVSTLPLSMMWADRAGQITDSGAQQRAYRHLDLSPDGTRVAVGLDGSNLDIWTYDIPRNVASRVTTNPAADETPRWSPDGTRLAYAGSRDLKQHLIVTSTDGSNDEERLWTSDDHLHVNGWRPDGTVLYFNLRGRGTGEDIWAYSFADKSATAVFQTNANEFGAAPSPDGRWIAYVSDASGQREVYLVPATGAGRTQVSRDGGVEPVWSRDATQLFFKKGDGTQLLAVTISQAGEPRVGSPQPVLRSSFAAADRDPTYAVTPDGSRFLFLRRHQESVSSGIEVTLNWFEELKAVSR